MFTHIRKSKMIPIVLGMAFFTSGALGGWKLWIERGSSASVMAETPVVPLRVHAEHPGEAAKEPEPAPQYEKAGPPSVVVAASATVKAPQPEQHKKEPIQGKNHKRQEKLLETMAVVLHAEAARIFVDQPGAGSRRMEATVDLMPREWKLPEWTSEELAKMAPPIREAKDLGMIHRLSLKTFADSSAPPGDKKTSYQWEIKSLDLVGLVVHDTPVVYVSEKLPGMNTLKTIPTREPDVFENEGIEELANGKALYMRSKEEVIRLLGPIHASKSCLRCHGDAREGDLLGAFSYTLRQRRLTFGPGRSSGTPGKQSQAAIIPASTHKLLLLASPP